MNAKLNTTAMAIAMGLLWGGGTLAVALVQLVSPGYGQALMQVMASIYPGFNASGGILDGLVGAGYALVDGAIGGWLLAWLYNRFTV